MTRAIGEHSNHYTNVDKVSIEKTISMFYYCNNLPMICYSIKDKTLI